MNNTTKVFIIACLCAASAWTVLFLIGFVVCVTSEDSIQYLGQFGDMFGSLNTFFSGLAMSGALYAIYLQTTQIKDQSDQIRRQRIHDERLLRRGKFERLMLLLGLAVTESHTCLAAAVGNNEDRGRAAFDKVEQYLREAELLATLYFPAINSELEQEDCSILLRPFVASEGERQAAFDNGEEFWKRLSSVMYRAISCPEMHIEVPPDEPISPQSSEFTAS
ncbi:MAG: hypothetical protein R3F13_05670 [Prosthecobacter sp.]